MHIERDLSYFDAEDETIEVAPNNGRLHGSASATAMSIVLWTRLQHPEATLRLKRHLHEYAGARLGGLNCA